MIEIPSAFGDITATWLDAALQAGGQLDVEVSSIEVEPLDPSKGLIGDLARVHAAYLSGVGPASFIVKLPAANPGSRRIGIMLNAYAREVAFYRDVAPALDDGSVPICFFAEADPANELWVLILEDCVADEFDFFAGATIAQAYAALDALADFHARWWEVQPFEWMPGFDTTSLDGLQGLWVDNLPAFFDRYAQLVPEQPRNWTLRFAPTLAEWCQRAGHQPLTMAHTDYRIDNLLFDGPSVTMIDWQTTMRAPAAMDLSCFIATSLTVDARREHEDDLIDRYLTRLEGAGVAIDRQWFAQSYDENLLWWMGQFGNNLAHLDPGDARVQSALDTMVERVFTAALDRDVGRLLD